MDLTPKTLYRICLTNGAWVTAEYIGTSVSEGYTPRYAYRKTPSRTHYLFTNVATGRQITIKSMRRIKPCEVKS